MWENRRVALVGLGKSNLALGKYLISKGIRVVGFDQKDRNALGERAREADAMGMPLVLGPSYLDHLHGYDIVCLTPGMKKSLPQIKAAEAAGAVLSSEINLVFELCKAPIIGVTGSAGKTTTVSLIGEMLRRDGIRPVYVGGNIGNPLIEVVEQIPADAIVVLELSSFQLQMLRKSPLIGVLLNISPNHLDVHDSMEEYVESKKNIFRFGSGRSWAVLNADDVTTRSMAGETPGRVALFSGITEVAVGTYLRKDRVIFSDGDSTVDCGSIKDRLIPGRHNVENILAATTAAMLAGARPSAVSDTIRTFPGVEHRLELVRVLNGVRYYNDSIATAPDRTLAALETVEGPIVLIAGGYDKGIGFSSLAEAIANRVKALVLLGATSAKIAAEVRAVLSAGGPHVLLPSRILFASSLPDAVAKAVSQASSGDAVLLSPACASFDMFTNFEERGRAFKALVNAL